MAGLCVISLTVTVTAIADVLLLYTFKNNTYCKVIYSKNYPTLPPVYLHSVIYNGNKQVALDLDKNPNNDRKIK